MPCLHLHHLRQPARRVRRSRPSAARPARTSGSTSGSRDSSWTTIEALAEIARGRAPRGRAGADQRRGAAHVRHRSTGAAGAASGGQRALGLRVAGGRGRGGGDRRTGRPERRSRSRIRTSTRRLSSGARRSATCRSTCTRPTPHHVRQARPLRRPTGPATRTPSSTGSRWCARAATSRARRCCTGRPAPRARACSSASDTVKVGFDRESVSVMRSYPNLIPVGTDAPFARIESTLATLTYDRIYAAWPGHHVLDDAQAASSRRSLKRYLQHESTEWARSAVRRTGRVRATPGRFGRSRRGPRIKSRRGPPPVNVVSRSHFQNRARPRLTYLSTGIASENSLQIHSQIATSRTPGGNRTGCRRSDDALTGGERISCGRPVTPSFS